MNALAAACRLSPVAGVRDAVNATVAMMFADVPETASQIAACVTVEPVPAVNGPNVMVDVFEMTDGSAAVAEVGPNTCRA